MTLKTSFKEKVLETVRNIKKGEVMTYKDVAFKSGSKGAGRAVGSFMKNNYDISVPCHRVVRSDGEVGDYNRGGRSKKIEILKNEGISFNGEKVVL
jgi:O-6-methylguanine DNA methyltransferase